MKLTSQFFLLERLNGLIRRKATGTPKSLSERLEISERTLYRHIDEMKMLGLPIEYCKHTETYYYTHDIQLTILKITPIGDSDAQKISAGKNLKSFFMTDNFWQSGIASLHCSYKQRGDTENPATLMRGV
jgi:hypothetical protein